MRRVDLRTPSFLGGLALGLAASGVALFTIRAAKRRSKGPEPKHPVIDGAKPIDPVALSVRPPEESSVSTLRLESEIEDVPPVSQRW